ncbi:RNA polymerase sigma factor [Olivibacter ginsenosidimutans]|uniref:RNA polymerase sigma factor n=1 Tax=Olivibacter ginsenosidimutans TaxID=1176537 RepID=UPI0031EA8E1E
MPKFVLLKLWLTMHAYGTKTDQELAFLLMADDPEALNACYVRYMQSLHYFVIRMAKSPTLTEDVLQETFVRLWQHRKQLNPSQNLKAYLFTIAHHCLLNLLKRAQHEFFILEELKHYSSPVENTTDRWLDYTVKRKGITGGH